MSMLSILILNVRVFLMEFCRWKCRPFNTAVNWKGITLWYKSKNVQLHCIYREMLEKKIFVTDN